MFPDGQQRTRTTNALGEVIKRTDGGGYILYEYNALGSPVLITTNGIVTKIEYDEVGRQIALHDPSAGTIRFEYFADGQLKRQTNANGGVTEFTYDIAGRIETRTVKDFRAGILISTTQTSYEYIASGAGIGQLRSVSMKENGQVVHKQTFEYNSNHLIASITDRYNDRTFTFSYTYDNLWRPLTVTSPSGFVTTNEFNAFGDLVRIRNGNTVIWEGTAQNSKGQFTEFRLGNGLTSTHIHNRRGELTEIRTGAANRPPIQHNRYEYDVKTGSLLMRNDLIKGRVEHFWYDELDRLIRAELNGELMFEMAYSPSGNILYKTDVGTFIYDETNKPFAVRSIQNAGEGISTYRQFIDYTPFNKISRVAQGESRENFTVEYRIFYGLDQQRIKTKFFENGELQRTRYYIGFFELDVLANGEEIGTDYVFAPTGLVAMMRTPFSCVEGLGASLYFVHNDRQGSIERITDSNGNLVASYIYCAWGSRKLYYGIDFTDRGYTGHEHLTALGLINMNGRVYDPVLARFLSPDPFVQAPDFTQSFNRYAYVWNNPFKYVDPTGELVCLAAGLFIVSAGLMRAVFHGQGRNGWCWQAAGRGFLDGAFQAFGMVTSKGMSFLNPFMPSWNISLSNNWSLNISPGFGFGTSGFSAGINAALIYNDGTTS